MTFVKPPLPEKRRASEYMDDALIYGADQMQARDAEMLRAVADWIEATTWMPIGGKLAEELRKAANE